MSTSTAEQLGAQLVPHPQPQVHAFQGQVMADSRDIAHHFEKAHKNVLRSIRNIHASREFIGRNFVFQEDATGATSHVLMTEDGFLHVVMAFTGAKAGQIRETFINAFREAKQDLLEANQEAVSLLRERQTLHRYATLICAQQPRGHYLARRMRRTLRRAQANAFS